jgi:hypothetical protein
MVFLMLNPYTGIEAWAAWDTHNRHVESDVANALIPAPTGEKRCISNAMA